MNKLFKSIISIIGLSMAFAGCVGAVSYTHLTLPTNSLV